LIPNDLHGELRRPRRDAADGNGTALLLEFGLPKASYATVAIREVMKMAKSLGVGDGLRP
jgi:tRNA(Glu) U13 pseudouridine synthase TruD